MEKKNQTSQGNDSSILKALYAGDDLVIAFSLTDDGIL